MNKKGFVFIETIIVTMILLVSLLSIYSIFNQTLIKERKRLYHDDVAYIYKAAFLKKEILDCRPDIEGFFDSYDEAQYIEISKILHTCPDYEKLKIMYKVKGDIFVFKTSYFDNKENLPNKYEKYYDGLNAYLKTINPQEMMVNGNPVTSKYIMIVAFSETKSGKPVQETGYINYNECMKDGTKKAMDCEIANNFTWVYLK